VRQRIRPQRILKRNGKRRDSRRICTPVLHGREVSSRRDLLPPSHQQLPNQQYPLLYQHQMANLSRHPPRSLLLTPHLPLLQLWRLSLKTNRASPLCLIHLVCLVDLVHLVRFVQPNKQDKPDNGFSSWLAIANVWKDPLQRRGRPVYCASCRNQDRPQCQRQSRRQIESRSPMEENSLSRGRPAGPGWGRPA
jgi:hypothetical protein